MLVPRIIKALLADRAMTAALDAVVIPVPDHTSGNGVPGCTGWPAHWTPVEIAERSRIPDPAHGWRRVRKTYAYYSEIDGVWTYVVTRGARDASPQFVAAFPVDWGRGVHKNPLATDLLSATVTEMFAILDAELEYPTVAWPGERMHRCGHRAEGTMWLLESADIYGVAFTEEIYVTLYLLALRGTFAASRPDAERIVAVAWARAYPATWGLTTAWTSDWTYSFQSFEPMIAASIIELAEVMLHNKFDDHWSAEALATLTFESPSEHVLVARHDDAPPFRATRTRLPDEDDPLALADDDFNNVWEFEFPDDPRTNLAGAVLAAAITSFDSDPDRLTGLVDSAEEVFERFLLHDVDEALVVIPHPVTPS